MSVVIHIHVPAAFGWCHTACPIGYLPAANTPIDIFYHCVDRFGAWSLENTAILQTQSSMMAFFIHNHNIYCHRDVNI